MECKDLGRYEGLHLSNSIKLRVFVFYFQLNWRLYLLTPNIMQPCESAYFN